MPPTGACWLGSACWLGGACWLDGALEASEIPAQDVNPTPPASTASRPNIRKHCTELPRRGTIDKPLLAGDPYSLRARGRTQNCYPLFDHEGSSTANARPDAKGHELKQEIG